MTLPGKGEARSGILIGEKVSTWQGWTHGTEGPCRASGSTDTIAVVAVVAKARV